MAVQAQETQAEQGLYPQARVGHRGGDSTPFYFPQAPRGCWVQINTNMASNQEAGCTYGTHLQESYWLYDGHGIPLCKVCDACKKEQLKRYRVDIFEPYEADEPIEPDEY